MSEHENSKGRGRFPRAGLLRFLGIALAICAVIWVGVTGRGSTAQFPSSLLQAEGLLLTALVFILGLSQGNLRRTGESTLADARHWEERVAKAYVEHPGTVSSFQIWEWASKDEWALRLTSGRPRTADEAWWARRYAQRPVDSWGGARLQRAWDLAKINAELERKPGSNSAPSSRRRRFLTRESTRILREHAEEREVERRVGAHTAGLQPLLGRHYLAEAAAQSLLNVAQVFIGVMGFLGILGAIYAGWHFSAPPPPELWAALAFPALAATYTAVLSSELARERTAFASGIRQSWLVLMHEAEEALGLLAEEEDLSRRTELKDYLTELLDRVQAGAPGIPWEASTRGRMTLLLALREYPRLETNAWLRKRKERKGIAPDAQGPVFFENMFRRHVLEVESLLRQATCRTDDPFAALAYAKLLALQADTAELNDPSRPQAGGGAIPKRLRTEADDWIERSLAALESSTASDSGQLWSGSYLTWLLNQRFLWPEDPASVERLKGFLPEGAGRTGVGDKSE